VSLLTHELTPRGVLRNFLASLLINTTVAVTLFLLNVIFDRASLRGPLLSYLIGNLVYSHSIGTLCTIFIPFVAIRTWGWPRWRFWPIFVVSIIAMATSGTLIAVASMSALGYYRWPNYWAEVGHSLTLVLVITLLMGIGGFLIGTLQERLKAITLRLKEKELENERILKLAAEARFDGLQARLQPHFLFNTINSILALIREDPRGAEQMLERLSRLLRHALDCRLHSTVPLGSELRLLHDYLEIERTRFGARLRFSISVEPGLDECEIPPYALQTLVENSMKYAVAARRDGGTIAVSARRDGPSLCVEVTDDGPGFARDRITEGHGLDTLEKRLALLFGPAGRLEIESAARCSVRFSLPLGGL